MKKKSAAVAGAKGYVGSAVCEALGKNTDYEVVPITRENYSALQGRSFDVLINSAMPSKRFWAKSHPEEDFKETVQKTADLIGKWKYGKFIQISTVSARCETDTVYGRHKAEAEKVCAGPGNLIVRLSAMYSPGLSKGALIDILNGSKVYVSGESRYAFTPLDFVGSWIASHLDRTGLAEVGAKNTLSLLEVAQYCGKKIDFEGPVEIQEIQNSEPDFPDVREVFQYLDAMKSAKGIH